MPTILYGCPHACSLVTHIALEHTSEEFAFAHVDLFSNAQRAPDFLALNPRGRVPVLATSDMVLTETPAILVWLSQRHPQAGILPAVFAAGASHIIADLSWFASGVHTALSRVMAPGRFVAGDACTSNLREAACRALVDEFRLIDRRLGARHWWLDKWSGLDAYLFWLWARSGEGPIDLRSYSNWARHTLRMLERPQVRRALDRERKISPCYPDLDRSPMQAS
ncbi:MAG TPA: glutathione S-transferase N-terminal domain-containing protein [Steroidobacteraceae bacterium]|nr:glutathione S-transferase N-terminal domain-containing protein [Steroidobacteraceae bacterium]